MDLINNMTKLLKEVSENLESLAKTIQNASQALQQSTAQIVAPTKRLPPAQENLFVLPTPTFELPEITDINCEYKDENFEDDSTSFKKKRKTDKKLEKTDEIVEKMEIIKNDGTEAAKAEKIIKNFEKSPKNLGRCREDKSKHDKWILATFSSKNRFSKISDVKKALVKVCGLKTSSIGPITLGRVKNTYECLLREVDVKAYLENPQNNDSAVLILWTSDILSDRLDEVKRIARQWGRTERVDVKKIGKELNDLLTNESLDEIEHKFIFVGNENSFDEIVNDSAYDG